MALPLTVSDDPSSHMHSMPFGAELLPAGGVRFRLWAPSQGNVRLVIEDGATLSMDSREQGWHELVVNEARAGTRYRFELGDGLRVPDPASRFQPQDVHGPSEVVDPGAFAWSDAAWRGRPWHEAVIYELHVGTFTPEGTFRSAIGRLDHLAELGVTAIELMPLGDFAGARNWGYDGVLLYAPDSAYGRPEDLKALIDAAHARGVMVFLDVIYNHFGPDGNYLSVYAPLFTDRHKTPWGAAINYDGENSGPVRDFVVHNALYWLEEFHFDGLRLDAVHAIRDDSAEHLLEEIARRVRALGLGRHDHLVLENEENQARLLGRDRKGEPELFTAQWNDDVHHVLHTAVTGEASGYYVEYQGDTAKLARTLAEGFAFQGEMMAYRGEARGEPSAHLPPTAFVAFLQNHDQIGNRAFGDRITAHAPPQRVRAAAAVYLLAPQIPMLFMGEEWAAPEPFLFFCDFGPELSEAVRQGRREEFARFPEFRDPETRARIPDPTAVDTFNASKLDWSARNKPDHAERLAWYRGILAVRQREIVPRLGGMATNRASHEVLGPGAVAVTWSLADGSALALQANLSDASVPAQPAEGRVLWSEGPGQRDGVLGPWSVAWRLRS